MPFNVAALADAKLDIAINIAAFTNTSAVMNLKVRIRVCFRRDGGIVCKLKQFACEECIQLVG